MVGKYAAEVIQDGVVVVYAVGDDPATVDREIMDYVRQHLPDDEEFVIKWLNTNLDDDPVWERYRRRKDVQ